jgi:hypothetical protein
MRLNASITALAMVALLAVDPTAAAANARPATTGQAAVGAMSADSSGGSAGAKSPSLRRVVTTASVMPLGAAVRAGHAETFGFTGSQVARGRHLHAATLNFGDGTRAAVPSFSKPLSHVYRKAGNYQVTLRVVDSAGGASVARRTVVIAGRDSIALKPTTRRVKSSQLLSLTPTTAHQETLRLQASLTTPRAGQVLLVAAGPAAPQGLIAVVLHAVRETDGTSTVTARDGNLADAYRQLRVASSFSVGRSLTLAPPTAAVTAKATATVKAGSVAAKEVPFECDTSGDKRIHVTADLRNTTVSPTFDLQSKIFSLEFISKPVFTMDTEFSGEANCHLNGNIALNIPVPSVPGLVISIAPYFDLHATGKVTSTVTWKPAVFLYVSVVKGKRDTFTQLNNTVDASANGSASVTLSGGLQVSISVAKAVGLTARIGPSVTTAVTASASSAGVKACIKVTAAIEAQLTLFAHVLFVDKDYTLYHGTYDASTLLDRCTSSGTASGTGTGGGGSGGTTGGGTGTPGTPPPGSTTYTGPSVSETAGGQAHTWTDYIHAGGTQGADIAAGQTVQISCKIIGFKVADGNTWWYQVASSPWNASYYTSADAFYNNGTTSGSLRGTPFNDAAVPDCAGSAGTPPSGQQPPTGTTPVVAGTYSETTGGVTHTWTDYTSAGGSQGLSIPSNTSVQIACYVAGFAVADGNTAWYRIASSPWDSGYYASADAFYNNGQTSGSLNGTPFLDPTVPPCASTGGGGGGGTPPPPPPGYAETTGGVTHTWTDYTSAGGTQGPSIATNQTVQVICYVSGFRVADGDTYWYRIASSPWNGSFYASADAFYNNGQTSGSLSATPFVDPAVPSCDGGGGGGTPPPPPPPPPTYGETTGGVTHTWTNYSNAGGTQGSSIPSNATVQIACRVNGFAVADGNTWWYRIASSPWSNSFYASADAFYNNGQTSGSLHGTPFVDPNVPTC